MQIVRLIIAGEEELNEPRAQTLCFVSKFNNDMISPEAVMKLRQKNPGAIRNADEDLGDFYLDTGIKLDPRSYSIVSSHLPKMCRGEVFSSRTDLLLIFDGNNDRIHSVSQDDSNIEVPRCYKLGYNEHKMCQCVRQGMYLFFSIFNSIFHLLFCFSMLSLDSNISEILQKSRR